MKRVIRIAGIRGIPASHGGFETFCERLAPALIKRGWDVEVYCQEEGNGPITEDEWNGIKRIHIPVKAKGPIATILFDWRCILHARNNKKPILILGYNTGIFSFLLRFSGIPIIFNMDGLEWTRAKWSWYEKLWLYINDVTSCWLGNRLIADHPEIAKVLHGRVPKSKVVTIPYGAPIVTDAEITNLQPFGLEAKKYALLIARPEPENSVLEAIKGYCAQKRPFPLVILGRYLPEENEYHREVQNAANDQVIFLGAIFDKALVDSLRFYASLYIHGHQVGGTNPSLVEALAAGNPVLAHDNRFNRWTAKGAGLFFSNASVCDDQLTLMLNDEQLLADLSNGSRKRYLEHFQEIDETDAYEQCLLEWL